MATPCHTPMCHRRETIILDSTINHGLQSIIIVPSFDPSNDRNFPCQTLKIRKVWGYNNAPCGRPAPGRPIGHPGSGRPQGVIGVFLVT
jgi:hypothetical protein